MKFLYLIAGLSFFTHKTLLAANHEKDSCTIAKIQVNINVFNALINRPYVGFEYSLNKKQQIVLQAGGIFANNTFQKQTVLFLKEDHYLFNGFFTALGWKIIDKKSSGYTLFLSSYKYSDYFNKEWNNGLPPTQKEALSIVQSGVKNQFTISIQRGIQKCISDKFYLDFFYGAGMRFSAIKHYYIQEIYNNENYKFVDKTYPFQLTENRLQPIIHLGVRLGLKIDS